MKQLVLQSEQHRASDKELLEMREELSELQAAKEKYREEALTLKEEMRRSR